MTSDHHHLEMSEGKLRAWISFPGAPYTQASAVKACGDVLLPLGWEIEEGDGSEAPVSQQLYLADYDLLPFEQLHPASFTPDSIKPLLPQLSSYPIRKSLIRKNYLASSLHAAQLKKGSNKRITPATWVFEATCADDLDELLMDDLYDVREALEKGEGKWFILKPAMADRGMGIRLFNSVDTLREIFDEFDAEDSDGESEQESEQGKEEGKTEEKEAERQTQEQEQTQKGEAERAYDQTASTVVMMSQLRHFVIQVKARRLTSRENSPLTYATCPCFRTTFATHFSLHLLELRKNTNSTCEPTFWPKEVFASSFMMRFLLSSHPFPTHTHPPLQMEAGICGHTLQIPVFKGRRLSRQCIC